MSTRRTVLLRRDINTNLHTIPKDDHMKLAGKILKLDPSERRDDEIQALQGITEDLQFFRDINAKKSNLRNRLHQQICSKMKYEASKKGSHIIEYGAKADKFFVLLKGSVLVFLAKAPEVLQSEIKEEQTFFEDKIPKSPQISSPAIRKDTQLSNGGSNRPSLFHSSSFMNQSPSNTHSPQDRAEKGRTINILDAYCSVGSSPKLEGSRKFDKKMSIQHFESINILQQERNITRKPSIYAEEAHSSQNSEDSKEEISPSSHRKTINKIQKKLQQKQLSRSNNNDEKVEIIEADSVGKQSQQQKILQQPLVEQQIQQQQHPIKQQKSIFGKSFHNVLKAFEPIVGKAYESINNLTNTKNSSVSPSNSSENYPQKEAILPVTMPTKDKHENLENISNETSIIRKTFNDKYMFSKLFGNLSASEIDQPEKLIHLPSFIFKFYYLRSLESGSTFGELGLLEGKPRSALIICAEDCEFGVMEKNDYQQLLGNIHRKELTRKFNFVKDHMLPELSNSTLKKVNYNFQKLKFKRHEYLFKQTQLSNGVFLIKKGEVQLEKLLMQEEDPEKLKNHRSPSSVSSSFKLKKKIPFATLSCGEYFGEEFIIFDLQSAHFRSYSAQVISLTASFYFMPTSSFVQFMKQSPELLEIFKQNVTNKIQRRQEYVEAIENICKESIKAYEANANDESKEIKFKNSILSRLSCSKDVISESLINTTSMSSIQYIQNLKHRNQSSSSSSFIGLEALTAQPKSSPSLCFLEQKQFQSQQSQKLISPIQKRKAFLFNKKSSLIIQSEQQQQYHLKHQNTEKYPSKQQLIDINKTTMIPTLTSPEQLKDTPDITDPNITSFNNLTDMQMLSLSNLQYKQVQFQQKFKPIQMLFTETKLQHIPSIQLQMENNNIKNDKQQQQQQSQCKVQVAVNQQIQEENEKQDLELQPKNHQGQSNNEDNRYSSNQTNEQYQSPFSYYHKPYLSGHKKQTYSPDRKYQPIFTENQSQNDGSIERCLQDQQLLGEVLEDILDVEHLETKYNENILAEMIKASQLISPQAYSYKTQDNSVKNINNNNNTQNPLQLLFDSDNKNLAIRIRQLQKEKNSAYKQNHSMDDRQNIYSNGSPHRNNQHHYHNKSSKSSSNSQLTQFIHRIVKRKQDPYDRILRHSFSENKSNKDQDNKNIKEDRDIKEIKNQDNDLSINYNNRKDSLQVNESNKKIKDHQENDLSNKDHNSNTLNNYSLIVLSPCLSPLKSTGMLKQPDLYGRSRKASFSPIPLSIEFNNNNYINHCESSIQDSCCQSRDRYLKTEISRRKHSKKSFSSCTSNFLSAQHITINSSHEINNRTDFVNNQQDNFQVSQLGQSSHQHHHHSYSSSSISNIFGQKNNSNNGETSIGVTNEQSQLKQKKQETSQNNNSTNELRLLTLQSSKLNSGSQSMISSPLLQQRKNSATGTAITGKFHFRTNSTKYNSINSSIDLKSFLDHVPIQSSLNQSRQSQIRKIF